MLQDVARKMIQDLLDQIRAERAQLIQELSDKTKDLIFQAYEVGPKSDGLIVVCSDPRTNLPPPEGQTVFLEGAAGGQELGPDYIEAVAEAQYHRLVDYVDKSGTGGADNEGILELRYKGRKIVEMMLENQG